jgi:hypothetical protein
MELVNIPIDNSHPIFQAFNNIQKSRSRFQLEKFVVGQHETPEQQYKQTLLEIQSLYYSLRIINLELQKDEIEIARLRSSSDSVDELNAQIKEIHVAEAHRSANGILLELKDLIEIWESFEHKYTYEELENTQPEYWKQRLRRQAVLESISGSQAQASHLDALRQIGDINITDEGIITANQSKLESKSAKELK